VKPPKTGIVDWCWQFRHWMCSSVALEDMTEAPMTMPGTRTSLAIVIESRLRIETSSASEWRSSWWSGRSTLASCGKTIRWVHLLRADSNCGYDISVDHIGLRDVGFAHEGDDLCRLRGKLVGELFVEVDEIVDVDIAVILL